MSQAVYRPREPQNSSYYQCVQDHFEAFEQVYEERFERRYGFFRPYVRQVIYRYLDCGDLHNGFARVRCGDCGHEYLLAFSCKRRHFCPSCHQKRVVEFGEWLCGNVVKAVPHRHIVFSIPKILRRCFLYDRKRLTDLSRCGWESLKTYFTSCSKHNDALPGAVIAIQTFGDLLGYHPHLHVLISDGCFHKSGMLTVAPAIDTHALEQLFRHKVLKLLLSEGRITEATVALMARWRHSGFSVHCGPRILPRQAAAMENLARYIIRASFSQERLDYDARTATVVYKSKDGSRQKSFDAQEWLAAMCSHVPNKGEQMVRYYGYYSNVCRGKRQKTGDDAAVAYVLEPPMPDKAFRKNWARLIQKIYEVDPLVCPACRGEMRVIAFIQEQEVIRKILTHLGLWLIKARPRPLAHAPPELAAAPLDDWPAPSVEDYLTDSLHSDEV